MWARPIGLSTSALRCVCRAADCPPKDSLDFGRLLRAVVRGRRARYRDIKNILDARDPRTLVRLVFVTLDEVAPPPWLDATDRAAFGPIVRDAE